MNIKVTPQQSLEKSKEKNKIKSARAEPQTVRVATIPPNHYTMSRTAFP